MTREEAIQWLKVINTKEFGWDEFALQESQREIRERCEQGVREAIDMAIKALSAEETIEIKPMEIKGDFHIDDDYKKPPQIIGNVEVVVRCKDCKWHKLTDNNDTEICTNKQWDISMAVYPIISADEFCSYGERREP